MSEATDSDIGSGQDIKTQRKRKVSSIKISKLASNEDIRKRVLKLRFKAEDDTLGFTFDAFKKLAMKSKQRIVISQSGIILNTLLKFRPGWKSKNKSDETEVDEPVSSFENLRKLNREQKAVESVESLDQISRRKRRGLKKGHAEDDAEDSDRRSQRSKGSNIRSTDFGSSSTDVIGQDKTKTYKSDRKRKQNMDHKTTPTISTESSSPLNSLKSTSVYSSQSGLSSVSSNVLDSSLVKTIENKAGTYSTITPVECYWVLQSKWALVCVHPVLGELRAHQVSSDTQDYVGWPDRNGYTWQAFYDPEVYTLVNPYIDDSKYSSRSGQTF